MTQEDKELLFKDLCARLPYHVRLKVWLKEGPTEEGFLDLEHNYADVLLDAFYYTNKIKDIKPYLRPLLSMTGEEREELRQEHVKDEQLYTDCIINHPEMRGLIIPHFAADWCNKNHFDYRGLIPKGLALVAPKDIYNNKK